MLTAKFPEEIACFTHNDREESEISVHRFLAFRFAHASFMRTFSSEPFLITFGLGPSLAAGSVTAHATARGETASTEYAECLNLVIRRGRIWRLHFVSHWGDKSWEKPRRRPCPKS